MMRLTFTRLGLISCLVLSASGVLAQGMDKLPASLLLNEFRVEGNTVLPAAAIERAVSDYLGPNRKLDDVYAAQDALAKVYETAGYVSASVRAVRLDPVEMDWGTESAKGWVVVLQVIEGRVERLKITGAQYNPPSEVKDRVPSIAEGSVAHFPSLQKELAQVASMADVTVTPLLRPGKEPGTMEVELKVEDKLPLHAWAQLSNEQSPDTSPRRLELGFRYDNLFQKQHSLSLRTITTPLKEDEIKVAALTYTLPIGKGDDRLLMYLVRSDSEVKTDTGTGVVGKGTTFGIRKRDNISDATKEGVVERLSYGADYKQLGEESLETGSKPVRYLPFALQYFLTDPDDSGRTELFSTLTSSFTGLMDRKVDCGQVDAVSGNKVGTDQFECRRKGASSSFLTWNSSLKREQKLGKWEAQGRLSFQFASGPVLSGDQFYIGGADTVRGYYQSEATGDDGASASLEFYTPNVMPNDWRWVTRFLVFVDAGWVRTQQPLLGQTSDYRLLGKGFGVRVEFGKHLSGSLDWGRAMLPGPRSKDGASRVNALVRAEF